MGLAVLCVRDGVEFAFPDLLLLLVGVLFLYLGNKNLLNRRSLWTVTVEASPFRCSWAYTAYFCAIVI
jgi:hypothetical protein